MVKGIDGVLFVFGCWIVHYATCVNRFESSEVSSMASENSGNTLYMVDSYCVDRVFLEPYLLRELGFAFGFAGFFDFADSSGGLGNEPFSNIFSKRTCFARSESEVAC